MTGRTRLLLTADTVGGVWQYATDLASALVPLGYDTILALLGPPPSSAQRGVADAIPGLTLIETGLPLDWLTTEEDEVRKAGCEVAALSRRMGADLVQLNQPALAATAELPAPLITVAHSCPATWWAAVEAGPMPADFAWRTALHGAGLRAADRVICPSDAFGLATYRAYALATPPHTVHNGRRALPHLSAAIHDFAFTAGRLWDRGKDVATLDRAAARLGVPVKAAGAVHGPGGEQVRFGHLQLMGQIGETTLAGTLSARPVFVSSACYEPFGLAVLEAAAAGCPLVLSDIATFRELWGDAATFVPPGDDQGFAAAIEALIGDIARRLAEGEMARVAARRFSRERMAGEMTNQYAALLPARRVAA